MRPVIFNPILYGKRLFQQFAVDTYFKIESSRLDIIRNNTDTVRADLYQGLVDSYRTGVEEAKEVGKRTVLSPTFISGPRDMRRRYMDAMTLVCVTPDFRRGTKCISYVRQDQFTHI
jgi:hypothetical protein